MTMTVPSVTLVDPAKLKPAPYNPRRISKRMMQALKASIREHGFVEPVVAQKSTRFIIGGHQRVAALKEVCREDGGLVPKIPVVLLDVDDRKAKLLNLALNKITGDFDSELLSTVLSEMKVEQGFSTDEILASGFTSTEIERILNKTTEDDLQPFARSVTLSLQFDTVEERDAVKALLAERQQKGGKKSGTIVRELLDAARSNGNRVP